MTIEEIKPIPKYILKLIEKRDKKDYPIQDGKTRLYSYVARYKKELIKITVAVRNIRKKWHCKQVAIHGVHADKCFVKDMEYFWCGGYKVSWYPEGVKNNSMYYGDGKWYVAKDKYYDPYAPIINIEYILTFPDYKYSVADKYSKNNIIKYLRIYEQYPQAEYLMKLGLQEYALSKMLLALLARDKAFRRWIIANKTELAAYPYFIQSVMFAYKRNMPIAAAHRYIRRKKSCEHDKDFKPIRELFKGKLLERFFNYIDEQDTSIRTYLDYLKACNYLQLDMTEDKNRLPHDFKRWHDIRINQMSTAKAIEDESKRKELYKSFAIVADKYLPLQNYKDMSYIVLIAKSPAELIREGDFLHHCVGRMGYDQKMVKENSLIFFIRNVAEPDTPFVTMEYSITSKKILQCYAMKNSRPSDTVLDFVNNKWLPFANRKIKKLLAA